MKNASDRANVAKRLFVAMVLPQTADFKIDEQCLRQRVRYYVNHRFCKVGGIIANPEAGEIYYMTREEKRRVLDIILEEVGGKMPVFAGTFGITTPETIQVARDAKAAGASGLFVIPPAGCMDVSLVWDAVKYPEVWINQIKAQAEAVDLPMITHPVVAPNPRTGIGLPVETSLKICAEIPQIAGWKMTYSYNGNRIMSRALREYAPHVAILQASAWFFQEFLATGYFDGSLSGSWNFAMEQMLDHIEAWQRGDIKKACEIWNGGLANLQEYIYSEGSRLHVRYKVATYLRGFIPSPMPRAPMPEPRPEEMETVRKLLVKANFPVIEGKAKKTSA